MITKVIKKKRKKKKKKEMFYALAGNRTRASRVAGENSTTEPPVQDSKILWNLSKLTLGILNNNLSFICILDDKGKGFVGYWSELC